MKQLLISIMLVLMLGPGGIGSNEMTTDRAYKSLLAFTQTDGDFLEYDKGRSMGEVIGVVKTGESKVEIIFTVVNPPGSKIPKSNGKATAFVTTDGKWILDCIEYEDEYGNIFTGRQECNVNRDMDEMAKGAISSTGNEPAVESTLAGNDELAPQGEVNANRYGNSGNEMTTDRAYKSLLGFTWTDGDFLEYDKGRLMGEVIGVVEAGESKVEIMFTVLNAPCEYTCDFQKWRSASNGKAIAFATTEGKWILDCIQYEDYYGSLMSGRQSCNLNRDMDEMAKNVVGTGLTVSSDGENLAFYPTSLTAKAGEKISLIFQNNTTALSHNFVLVKGGDDVAAMVEEAASEAGEATGYIPADKANIIAGSALLGPGTSEILEFTAPAAGTYTYICTYPGHFVAGMYGTLTIN